MQIRETLKKMQRTANQFNVCVSLYRVKLTGNFIILSEAVEFPRMIRLFTVYPSKFSKLKNIFKLIRK
jgi:hypothetical protein